MKMKSAIFVSAILFVLVMSDMRSVDADPVVMAHCEDMCSNKFLLCTRSAAAVRLNATRAAGCVEDMEVCQWECQQDFTQTK